MTHIISFSCPDHIYDWLKEQRKRTNNMSQVVVNALLTRMESSDSYQLQEIKRIEAELHVRKERISNEHQVSTYQEVEEKHEAETKELIDQDQELIQEEIVFVTGCYRKARTDSHKHPDGYVDVRVSLLNENLATNLTRNEYLKRVMEPAKEEASK